MARRTTDSQFRARWRILSMDAWGKEFIDLVGPGFIEFDDHGGGEMRFGAVHLSLDCRSVVEPDRSRLEFTFEGFDEGDAVSGRGWAELEGKTVTGHIYIHNGDDSGFTAKKARGQV